MCWGHSFLMSHSALPLMDLELVRRQLKFYRRNKKWVVMLALLGVSGYGAYRVYNLPSVSRKRKKLMKLFSALVSMAEMVSSSAEAISVVSKDMKEFLRSESDEIPNSLKQISKIAKSDEFSEALSRVSEALTAGILRGYKGEPKDSVGAQDANFTEKVMDKLFSPAGTGFVSVVVGSFAKNVVLGFYAEGSVVDGRGKADGPVLSQNASNSSSERWMSVVCNDKSRELIGDCIQRFVSAAVAVYLDKTLHINFYDELFSGLTNPNHESKIRDILVSLCNGAVETLVKTSHQVLTSPNSGSQPSGLGSPQKEGNPVSRSRFFEHEVISKQCAERVLSNGRQSNQWFGQAMTTLAVPSNRKFVLDVTGRVTFETIRSFVAFLLWRLSECMKKGVNVVHDEVLIRGRQMVGFIAAKSCVIVTICLALYLHVYGFSRALLPA